MIDHKNKINLGKEELIVLDTAKGMLESRTGVLDELFGKSVSGTLVLANQKMLFVQEKENIIVFESLYENISSVTRGITDRLSLAISLRNGDSLLLFPSEMNEASLNELRASISREISTHSKPQIKSGRSEVKSPSKFCRYCGMEIKSDTVFCENCGKRLVE